MKNISLKFRLILAFIVVSIIPVMAVVLFSYYNSSKIIKENAEEAAISNISQTGISLDVWLSSYEDILFQIYTNDEIVALIDTINRNDADYTVASGQLRRTLRGLFYAKEHIKSITVITENGSVVFYDLLTGSTTKNSWLSTLGISKEELYEIVSQDNVTHMVSTKYAGFYANENYYLFHLGHRIIDYKDVDRQVGIVIVSIDEKLLREICGYKEDTGEFTFITDKDGFLISFPMQELLGEQVIEWVDDEHLRNQQYLDFIKKQNIFTGQYISLKSLHYDNLGYDIIHVSTQNEMISRLENQRNITMLITILSTILLILIIIILTHNLTSSLQILMGKMKRAENGELSVRVDMDARMLPEVETIATQFNRMLDEISNLMVSEKSALERLKNAEIEALEAQINPHFLYNTLDTINWIAIDKNEYEISNSIVTLATILRYGINKSNSIVTVQRESEWLKQYLFLQQTRLKNQFEYEIHVAPEVLDYKIHKLLLQPFVENAILHGFEGKAGLKELKVIIKPAAEMLSIEIYDNGKGIGKEMIAEMNQGIFPKSTEKDNHIGMENALTRIQIYYPEESSVRIESELGCYTRVLIYIPKRVE